MRIFMENACLTITLHSVFVRKRNEIFLINDNRRVAKSARAVREEKKTNRTFPFSRKKKTDFIHSYVRNCIMFLIGRERRRCLYVSGVRRTPKWLKNRVIIDLSRVDAEVAVCVEGKLANARLRDVSDTILLSSSILYVWIDD